MFLFFIYVFIYGLFNDGVSRSGCRPIVLNDGMINELERLWKETVVT
jgi:hypothetical protein